MHTFISALMYTLFSVLHTLISVLKASGRVLIGLERIVIALIIMTGLSVYGLANYQATVGSGTNFGSVIIGGVHFFSNLVCDFTTANQCAAVKAASTPAALTDPALTVQNATEHNDLVTLNTSVQATGTIQGGAANGIATAGNPVQAGCVAESAEAAVLAGQAASLVCDLARKLIVLPYANPENFVSGVTAAMTGTTTTSLIAAPAAGLRNYVTQLICTNSHATVGTFVVVQDGSGGTTIYEGYAAAVGGGFSITFPAALRQPTTATAIFVADVTTGANVICSGSGYKGA